MTTVPRTTAHAIRTNIQEKYVGFVAAAVSMPMGGCRARRPVDDVSLAVVAVDIPIAAELAVL